jgi:hypothetical protein
MVLAPGLAGAQVTPPTRPDSIAAGDSVAADSARVARELARQRALVDTLRRPLARAAIPAIASVDAPMTWNREALWATGALTLGELVDRVPGVTTFRSGWIAAPEMAAWLGRFGRVRIFLDGIELDGLNARMRGLPDLSSIDLWHLEDAVIEPGVGEVRVHLRSWQVTSTVPVTRIDINTGDLQTNVFRGFYGRRFPTGHALQLGGSHYSTIDRRTAEEGDHTSFWGRLGWASGKWSVDGQFLTSGREYTERQTEIGGDTIPTLDGISTVAIGRVGWGQPGDGAWAQAIVSSQRYSLRNPPGILIDSVPGPGGGGPDGSPAEPDTISVSNDTTRTGPQYVLTGGLGRGPVDLTATARIRRRFGGYLLAPSVRAAFSTGPLVTTGFAERSAFDSTQRLDVSSRVALPANFAIIGALSRTSPILGNGAPTSTSVRGEIGRRFGRMWWTGGVIHRDTTELPAAIAFDSTFLGGSQGPTTGFFATIKGKFYRDIGLDIIATRYSEEGTYLPQFETRSRLYLDSDMRNRFPSGNLNVLIGLTHEYRTQALFPTSDGVLSSSQYRTWGADLEIRLLTATITFLYRNFLAEEYAQVPGFRLPGITSYYGIRWNFIN